MIRRGRHRRSGSDPRGCRRPGRCAVRAALRRVRPYGRQLPFPGNETIEPRDVTLSRLVAMFEQAAGIAVKPLPTVANGALCPCQPFHQLGPPALKETDTCFGRKVSSEGQSQAECPLVFVRADVGSKEFFKELLTPLGDAVDLLAPTASRAGLASTKRG